MLKLVSGKRNFINLPNEKIKVRSLDVLKLNQMKLIHVGKKRIVIANTEKTMLFLTTVVPTKAVRAESIQAYVLTETGQGILLQLQSCQFFERERTSFS